MSFNPPTPRRKALRCRGLRVNRCPAGHPLTAEPSKVRLFGLVRAWGSVRVTLRVLRPDGCAQNPDRVAQNPGGDVRQDISLLVARDTGAQSAGVTGLRSLSACGVRSRTPIYRSGWRASVLSHSFRRPGVVSLQNFFPISSSEKLPRFLTESGQNLVTRRVERSIAEVDCAGATVGISAPSLTSMMHFIGPSASMWCHPGE